MLFDLFDKLIDRLIQLHTHHKSRQKERFQQFAEPIYSTFKEIHNDYLISFKKYKNIFENDALKIVYKFNNLLDEMENDSIYSMNLRDQIIIAKYMIKKNDIEYRFLNSIVEYLAGSYIYIPDGYKEEFSGIHMMIYGNFIVAENKNNNIDRFTEIFREWTDRDGDRCREISSMYYRLNCMRATLLDGIIRLALYKNIDLELSNHIKNKIKDAIVAIQGDFKKVEEEYTKLKFDVYS